MKIFNLTLASLLRHLDSAPELPVAQREVQNPEHKLDES
jgi:hypothetical protein